MTKLAITSPLSRHIGRVTVCADPPLELSHGSSAPVSTPSHAQPTTFARFYEAHVRQVYRLIACFGTSPNDIEDLTQRVFVVACHHAESLDAIENPLAWLRAIAVRVVHEHRRWARVRRIHAWMLEHTFAGHDRDDHTPEQRILEDETFTRVRAVLDRLSPKLRDVLVLVELEELAPREAAELLQVPLNTVRSRRALARAEFLRLWQSTSGDRR